jgi:hypothetical protein
MKLLYHELPITILPIPGPYIRMSQKAEMTSALFLNTTQAGTVKRDPSMILAISDNINKYHLELQIMLDLQAELGSSQKDNLDYAWCIRDLERDLETTNGTIWILQKLAINAPNV